MKKIIILGLLLFIATFAYTSKKQPEKLRNMQYDKDEKYPIINRNIYTLKKFDDPIENNFDLSDEKPRVKHLSRHQKGKIIYSKKNSKTNHYVLE